MLDRTILMRYRVIQRRLALRAEEQILQYGFSMSKAFPVYFNNLICRLKKYWKVFKTIFSLYSTLKAAGLVIIFALQTYQGQKWFPEEVLSIASFLVFKSLCIKNLI